MAAPLWLSEDDVEALLDPAALMMAVEAGFRAADSGAINEPGSTRLDGLDGGDAYLTLYPAFVSGGLAGTKLLAGRPANAAEGRPEIDAVMALVDPPQGRIVALIAARALTALRTAAATAVLFKRLVHGAPARIGLIGTGAQARAHGRMLAKAGLASGFLVTSPRGDLGRAERLADFIEATCGITAVAAPLEALARQSEALVLMTLAREPLALRSLRADALIAGIGPFYPDRQELAPDLVAGATLVVSDHPTRLRRQWAGSSLLDVEALPLVSAADLLAGAVKPATLGRRVFLSDGRAFQDTIAAILVYNAARAAGRGLPLP